MILDTSASFSMLQMIQFDYSVHYWSQNITGQIILSLNFVLLFIYTTKVALRQSNLQSDGAKSTITQLVLGLLQLWLQKQIRS